MLPLCGCGQKPVAIHGRVTLDGLPLDEAAVQFIPGEAGRKKTGATIVRGEYRLQPADALLPGSYRVDILDLPPLAAAHAMPAGRRVIPPRYSQESPITIEIPDPPPADPRYDFELTTD